ncbi:Zn-dependent hydrolase [Chitinophaga agrisoli]|uniref:Zn-dependent hydrolase n=1 Tax=Chitinophaga agrisoli TaxID=2607653 RepID=A0A5B2VU87_9BACT|nr:MBL fold metallo-hydrolase [Chitinophaga agrisoli]KAA2241872.1 Zn-dependent hydrolase [Chitinophaga agrisoli]
MPFTSNPDLITLPPSPDWQGTPVDSKGHFMNLEHPYVPGWLDVLKWKLKTNPFKEAKRAPYRLPISPDASWLQNEKNCIVWLGHCTFFIRLDKICFLTDPVFGNILLTKRITAFPIDPNLLKGIHYILLSHDHRDHCDKSSLQQVIANNPQVKVLTGLRMDELLKKFNSHVQVSTAGWYQQYNDVSQPLSVYFVPTRHWSKRGPFDNNERLWGGFVIKRGQQLFYFGGDSGYDGHYQLTARIFGPFDYALLGIGAFEPQWFMHPHHQSPADAIRAFRDLQAQHLIPMHYSTFDLADEPLALPLQALKQTAADDHLSQALLTPLPGEAVYL